MSFANLSQSPMILQCLQGIIKKDFMIRLPQQDQACLTQTLMDPILNRMERKVHFRSAKINKVRVCKLNIQTVKNVSKMQISHMISSSKFVTVNTPFDK